MKTPQQKLSDYLEIEGWDIEITDAQDLEWWADEIWKLKSRWSPVGTSAYITFLVDPMFEGNRIKGQAVWGVGASELYPASQREAQSTSAISLKSGIKNEIEGFIEKIEGLRSCAINDIGI